MRTRTLRIVVPLLTAALLAQPVLGGPVLTSAHGLLADETALERYAAAATSRRSLDDQRRQIEASLVELERTPALARSLAARLTAEDLAVLVDCPLMLQAAGNRNLTNEAYFWGAIIVAGIVVLAANGSGSVMVH